MKNSDSLKIAGKLLKSKREEKGLSVEEVCIELRLNKEIILNIENSKFNAFKSYLFLKGYINNYANFLGVEVSLPDIEKQKNKKNPSKKNNKKKIFTRKINITIFLSFLIIFLISSQFFYSKSEDIKNDSLSSEYEPNVNAGNNKNIENENEKVITKEITINENKIFIDESPDKNYDNSFFEESENNINSKSTEANVLEPNIGKMFLEIEYSADSWTEIIDSNEDIVFFDLVKKGKTLKINILAPFEILFGDATAVNIKYNNKIVSIPYFNPDTNVGKITVKE